MDWSSTCWDWNRRRLRKKLDKRISWVKAYFIGSFIGSIGTAFFGILVGWFISSLIGYAIGWLVTFFLIKTGRVKPVLAVGALFIVLCISRMPEILRGMNKFYLQGYGQLALTAPVETRLEILDLQNIIAVEKELIRSRLHARPRALVLKRVKDGASLNSRRREALLKQNFTIDVAGFASWAKCNAELKRHWMKYKKIVLLLCLSSTACLVSWLYLSSFAL